MRLWFWGKWFSPWIVVHFMEEQITPSTVEGHSDEVVILVYGQIPVRCFFLAIQHSIMNPLFFNPSYQRIFERIWWNFAKVLNIFSYIFEFHKKNLHQNQITPSHFFCLKILCYHLGFHVYFEGWSVLTFMYLIEYRFKWSDSEEQREREGEKEKERGGKRKITLYPIARITYENEVKMGWKIAKGLLLVFQIFPPQNFWGWNPFLKRESFIQLNLWHVMG